MDPVEYPLITPSIAKWTGQRFQGIWVGYGVIVYHKDHIPALYHNGFFGKGILSRSKPVFGLPRHKKRRRKTKVNTEEGSSSKKRERQKRGFHRDRRKQSQSTRAAHRSAVGANSTPLVDDQHYHLQGEAQGLHQGSSSGAIPLPHRCFYLPLSAVLEELKCSSGSSCLSGGSKTLPIKSNCQYQISCPNSLAHLQTASSTVSSDTSSGARLESLHPGYHEPLQLSLEEAFFLAYALGVMDICAPRQLLLTVAPRDDQGTSGGATIGAESAHPPQSTCVVLSLDLAFRLFASTSDNFVSSYVVYHHFRSAGWVPRSGLKFGTDWVLYRHGPSRYHAEWGVRVLLASQGSVLCSAESSPSWALLNNVNRVSEQVSKGLLLCYVYLPSPDKCATVECLKETYVHEVKYSRWLAEKART